MPQPIKANFRRATTASDSTTKMYKGKYANALDTWNWLTKGLTTRGSRSRKSRVSAPLVTYVTKRELDLNNVRRETVLNLKGTSVFGDEKTNKT